MAAELIFSRIETSNNKMRPRNPMDDIIPIKKLNPLLEESLARESAEIASLNAEQSLSRRGPSF